MKPPAKTSLRKNESLTCDEQNNYLLCKNLASLAFHGIWPFQRKKFLGNGRLRMLQLGCGLTLYVSLVVFLVAQCTELLAIWGHLEDMTTNMSVTCLSLLGILKIFTVFLYREKLQGLISDISAIEVNILTYQNEEIKSILRSYVLRARKLSYSFWALTASTVTIFFLIPPIDYTFNSKYHQVFGNGTESWSYRRPMVFSSWFPFDRFAYPNYLIAYLYHVCMGAIGASYQAIWDTFVVSMMYQAIGQLKILQKMLEDVIPAREVQLKADLRREELIHQRLVHCVHHHIYITRFTQSLNSITSPLMFIYFLICSLMLCAIGFQASLYGFSLRLCFMIEYLFALMAQLFLFYWHANEVICENEKLSAVCYSCCWYEESPSFKSSLLIMNAGMERRLALTVGPFYTMSLPTFIMILKSAYSFFALLRQLQDAQEK